MDIIVETADGSIVNIEVQKIGYMFPGERAACYSADLLLRQYQRVRKEAEERERKQKQDKESGQEDKPGQGPGKGLRGKEEPEQSLEQEFGQEEEPEQGQELKRKEGQRREKEPELISGKTNSRTVPGGTFSYKNIHPVFTIVLMETSTEKFHAKKEAFFHRFSLKSDTGLDLNLLQNYIFIPLDIFKKHIWSSGITTERDAWLAFLSCDDPKVISTILDLFPDIFRELYERICDLCRNTEEVMNMFSKELAELDRNTTLLMIEEMQDRIDKQAEALLRKDEALQQKDTEIAALERRLATLEAGLLKEK
ncbi:MAG: hypothetical protein Q4D81_14925 [Eubacteriales bacterium]|nr:hypothetical protein [Eubacteriales bacterium]